MTEDPLLRALAQDPKGLYEHLIAKEARMSGSRSLAAFVKQAWHIFEPASLMWGWHMDAICEHLEALARGQIRRLVVNVPPRSSKSSLSAILFPAWVWSWAPRTQFMYLSYAATLSVEHSVKCRQVIESPWYRQTHMRGWQLRADQNVKHDFVNTVGGRRRATSIDGGITGHGADIIVIDDPVNAEDCYSKPARERAWRVISEAISTRFNDPKTGRGLCIMQRFHEEDPAQHLIDAGWTHLMLPMEFEADRRCMTKRTVRVPATVAQPAREEIVTWTDPRTQPGEVLFADRVPKEEVDRIKVSLGAFAYACTPAETPILMSDWKCKPIAQVRPGDEIVGFSRGTPNDRAILLRSTVLRVFEYEARVDDLVMESGRTVRCTEDHRWYTGRKQGAERSSTRKGRETYAPARVGSRLRFVCPTEDIASTEEIALWNYLAGIVDGEGSVNYQTLRISQSPEANPLVWRRIQEVLGKLGVEHTAWTGPRPNRRCSMRGEIWTKDTRSVYRKLLRFAPPAKAPDMIDMLFRRGKMFVREKDLVVAIKKGRKKEKVYALETSTGNYIAWGYASSNSQFQQRPAPEGGGIFKVENWRFWRADDLTMERLGHTGGARPRGAYDGPARVVDLGRELETQLISVDATFRETKDGSFVAIHVWARSGADRLLLYRVHRRMDFTDTVRELIAVTHIFPQAIRKLIEGKANGDAIISALSRTHHISGCEAVPVSGSKLQRAHAMQPHQSSGHVLLPDGAPWLGEYIAEHAQFPNGSSDDDVDAQSQALQGLEKVRTRAQTGYLNLISR